MSLLSHKRYLVSALFGLVAVAAVACGGDSENDDGSATAASGGPTGVPQAAQPAAAPTATAVPDPRAAVPAPVSDEGLFTWAIVDVDEGTKPALALTGDGIPYVAYMLEAQDGFVKNAVRSGSSWAIRSGSGNLNRGISGIAA